MAFAIKKRASQLGKPASDIRRGILHQITSSSRVRSAELRPRRQRLDAGGRGEGAGFTDRVRLRNILGEPTPPVKGLGIALRREGESCDITLAGALLTLSA
jgi:hypothetical protein